MSLVKDTMLDNIKGIYMDDAFFFIFFWEFVKKSITQKKFDDFSTYVMIACILHYNSRICILEVGD
jgi:hypothetical protein